VTATNHALTGTAIGLIVGQPLLALPLALLSHFICDAIPHFGWGEPRSTMKSNVFRNYLVVEAVTCSLIVLSLAVLRPTHWLIAAVCAFLAASPDLLSFNRYRLLRHDKKWKPSLYARFASRIQWFEHPIGAVVEVAWFIAALAVIIPIIK
jgi:hypothetical protein